jgi:hypothetical protein
MKSIASLVVLATALAGCGNITRKQDDAGVAPDDMRMIDAGSNTNDDAMTDAMMALPPSEAREIGPGGARMSGATYTFDVQLGHGTAQVKAAGTTYSIEGNTGIKP